MSNRYKNYVKSQSTGKKKPAKTVGNMPNNNEIMTGKASRTKASGNSNKVRYDKRGTRAPGLDRKN
jgi:hypothetical protein